MTNSFYEILQKKVLLISDFTDYYDEYFLVEKDESKKITDLVDDIDNIFIRFTCSSASRKERVKNLVHWELLVPPADTSWNLSESLPEEIFEEIEPGIMFADTIAVVLDNPREKYGIFTAAEQFRDKPATLFIDPKEIAVSYRNVRIGYKDFWLRYEGDHLWNSHIDSTITLLKDNLPDVDLSLCRQTPYPMHSIDFIESTGGKFYAIDYSPAVPLRGTPIEKLLSAEEIAYQVKTWIVETSFLEAALTEVAREIAKGAIDGK